MPALREIGKETSSENLGSMMHSLYPVTISLYRYRGEPRGCQERPGLRWAPQMTLSLRLILIAQSQSGVNDTRESPRDPLAREQYSPLPHTFIYRILEGFPLLAYY